MRGYARMLWSRIHCPDPREALGNTHLSRLLIKNFLLRNQLADVTPSVRVDGACGVDVGAM